MLILIPAYQPDERLVALVRALQHQDPTLHFVVVDDGSGPTFAPIFDAVHAIGAHVLSNQVNRGKGFSLKRGFAYAQRQFPGESVVCADCDGQHTPSDILCIVTAMRTSADAIVLGARTFAGEVPFRSRFGNDMTRRLFSAATRRTLQDTQTGLRGFSAEVLPWLGTIAGDRFEYELSVLLAAARLRIPIREIGIDTLYLEHNATSHFRPLQDSVRIMLPLVKFAGSSLLAFALDTAALLVLHALTASIPLAAVGARAMSSTVNFVTNRNLVFADRSSTRVGLEAARYWSLVAALLLSNILLLAALTWLGLSLFVAKVVTEATLFLASFRIQRRFVFARPAFHELVTAA